MSESQWLQVNVALSRVQGTALTNARLVLAKVADRLPAWRQEHGLGCFFFMRKPPDLRLRFAGPDPASRLWPELKRMLRLLRELGAVERFGCSQYEPENRLFGGAAAMRLVHRHFDCDSSAWVELDRLSQAGCRTALSIDTMPMGVLNDLFLRVLGDRFEVWDVWRNLAMLTNAPDTGESETGQPGIYVLASLLPALRPQEATILKRYERANQALSRGLRRLDQTGRLDAGLRGILPFVAMFHLHRHGYGRDRQAALAQAMSNAWNPRHGFHGAAARKLREKSCGMRDQATAMRRYQ
jgi:thiopeptide-type bacteriocin biosynthesis protein